MKRFQSSSRVFLSRPQKTARLHVQRRKYHIGTTDRRIHVLLYILLGSTNETRVKKEEQRNFTTKDAWKINNNLTKRPTTS